jgi:hypothetical protein
LANSELVKEFEPCETIEKTKHEDQIQKPAEPIEETKTIEFFEGYELAEASAEFTLKEVYETLSDKIFIFDFLHKAINMEEGKISLMFMNIEKFNQKLGLVPFSTGPFSNLRMIRRKTWLYYGEIKEGEKNMREGRGIFVNSTSRAYIGEWKENRYEGTGRMLYENNGS